MSNEVKKVTGDWKKRLQSRSIEREERKIPEKVDQKFGGDDDLVMQEEDEDGF